MWTPARIAIYLTILFGGVGSALAALGWAVYNPAAGTITVTVSIPVVVGILSPIMSTALAAVAASLGWGKK